MAALAARGISVPTPIQAAVLPRAVALPLVLWPVERARAKVRKLLSAAIAAAVARAGAELRGIKDS